MRNRPRVLVRSRWAKGALVLALAAPCALARHAHADALARDLSALESKLAFFGDFRDPSLEHARQARSRSLAFDADGRHAEAVREGAIAAAALELAAARARLSRSLAAYARYANVTAPPTRLPDVAARLVLPDELVEAATKTGDTRDPASAARATVDRLRAHARIAELRAAALEQALPAAPPRSIGEAPRTLASHLAEETARETFDEASVDEPRRYGSIERERGALRERARHDLLVSMPRRLRALEASGLEDAELARYRERLRVLADEADHADALVGLEDLADDLDARARSLVAH